MAVTVYLDLPEGASVKRTREGWEAVRIAKVDGLTGDPDAILYNAATASGMPAYNSAHPTIPGLYLKEIHPRAIGACQAEVRLVYKPLRYTGSPGQDPVITVGSTVEQVQTYEDINGTEMIVTHDSKDQVKQASVFRPKTTLHFVREETDSARPESEAYVGKVNAAGWNIAPTDAARTWMCWSIISRSTDGGDTWTTEYIFVRKLDPPTENWDKYEQYTDPQTGCAPSGLDSSGRKVYQHYAEANFNALGLD
jgi:hypothetical protein